MKEVFLSDHFHGDGHVEAVDDSGETIASGRQAATLQQNIQSNDAAVIDAPDESDDESWSRPTMTTFDIDHLPQETIRQRGGVRVAQYPGLNDQTPKAQAASEFRWMVVELRVSLFAQPLGTSVKVSAKRCEKLL